MATINNNINVNAGTAAQTRYKVKVAGIEREYEMVGTNLSDATILATIASVVPSVNPAEYPSLTWTQGTDEQGSFLRTSLLPKSQNKGGYEEIVTHGTIFLGFIG